MLTGDRGQHCQWRGQAQLLNCEVPPPEGRERGRWESRTLGHNGVCRGHRETVGTTSQVWDSPGAPGRRDGAPQVVPGCGPAQKCPHQGFFTEMSSSFRKRFCSIHLSLRNLDLQASGGQQGRAEGLTTVCAHTKGHSSHRKPSTALATWLSGLNVIPQSQRSPVGFLGQGSHVGCRAVGQRPS